MINKKSGKNIQSVQRALDILDCFDETHIELTLNEISLMLGINKSTVHGLLNTLHNNNYIQQNDKRKYLLGQALLEKCKYFSNSLQTLILSLSKPHMQQISATYQVTANLFVVSDGIARFFHQVISASAIYALTQVSTTAPLYATATGKLALSQMDEATWATYKKNIQFESFSPTTITDETHLQLHLAEIRANGYAHENQELAEGVSALSAPIFNKNQEWIAAISIVGMAAYIADNKRILVEDLKKACTQISSQLATSNWPI